MKITIRLFAVLRERAGVSEMTINLPDGATVAAARDALVAHHPTISTLIGRIAYAVNRNYAPLETELHDGDEVAVIPPVSGGVSP